MTIVWIVFFIVFARANIPLRRMVINPKTDDVFIAEKDAIFQLNGSDLKISHKAVTGPLIDNANCFPPTWTVPTGNCFFGGNVAKFLQSNFNQLLLFNESGDSLLVCGNLETGTCDLHDIHDVEKILLNETDSFAAAMANGVGITEVLVVSRDVAQNTAGVVSYDHLGRPALFVAATVRSSVTSTFLPPNFAVRSMTPTEFMLPLAKLELKNFAFPILGSFVCGNFVYFLSNDNGNLLSQICRQDAGFELTPPTFNAYMEARLYCNGLSLTYKYMTSFTLNPASANLAKQLNISVGNDVLIGVYNTMADGSGPSAICAVALETIERAYKERQDRCRMGEAGVQRGFAREVSPLDLQQCLNLSSNIWDGLTCAPAQFQLLLEIPENEPINATALYEQPSGLTAVSFLSFANDTVLFAGQSDGKILKLLLMKGFSLSLVSTITTSSFLPIKELKLGYDQSQLFALTDSTITRIPVQECDALRNCSSCFSNADPFCGHCHQSTFYNLLPCLSDAPPLCTSPVLVTTQPKTVYRLNGTSLDLIAVNQTSLRIDWLWKLNGSSLLSNVTGNGSNFFHPTFDTGLLRIQSVGSELDGAMFQYAISSQILGQPPLFTSNFITVLIGSGAAITTTNISSNRTVKVIEKTQETIYIETEGLPSVNKTALKLDQGNWNITRLGLFDFTDELLNINPSSVEDSGIYRIDVSNCFNTATIEFNLIVEEIDACESNPCQNNGTCTKIGPSLYECECSRQYTGILCESLVSTPSPPSTTAAPTTDAHTTSVKTTINAPATPYYCTYTGLIPAVTTVTTQSGDTVLQCVLQGKESEAVKSDNETIVDWSFLDVMQLSEKELENSISFIVDSESRVTFPQLVVRGRYQCCVSCSRDNTSVCSKSTEINPRDVKLFRAKLTFSSFSNPQQGEAFGLLLNISFLKRVTVINVPNIMNDSVFRQIVYSEIYNTGQNITSKTLEDAIKKTLNSTAAAASGNGRLLDAKVDRLDACESASETTPYGNFTWPDVPIGEVHAIGCPRNNWSVATRKCEGSFSFVTAPTWNDTDPTGCSYVGNVSDALNFLKRVTINDQTALLVSKSATVVTENGQDLQEDDVTSISAIIRNIADSLDSFDENVLENMVELVSNTLDANDMVVLQSHLNEKSSTTIVLALEKIASRTVLRKGNQSLSILRPNLAVELYQPSVSDYTPHGAFSGYYFGSKALSNDGDLSPDDQLSDDQLFSQWGYVGNSYGGGGFEALLRLPADLFGSGAGSTAQERLHFFLYQNGKLFQSPYIEPHSSGNENFTAYDWSMRGKELNTLVIGVSVGTRKTIDNLTSPVQMQFTAFETPYKNASCVYWDVTGNDGFGEWTDKGCVLVYDESGNFTCNCTHLTNFAVLVDPYEDKNNTSTRALSIISYIGCGLSLLGLILTLFTHIAIRPLRQERPGKILINLCVAMIFGLLFFVIYGENRGNAAMCTATAFLLHYFWLASLCWMGVEGVNMYLSLVKVLGSYVRQFTFKAGLVAWGLPLVVLAITAGVDYPDAYKKESQTKICRVSTPAFYGAFYGVLAAILAFNLVIFAMVMRALSQRAKSLGSARKTQNRLRMAVAISLLLGLNWIFAVWATEEATVRLVFNYLFAVTASFQGFLIFIFYCVLRKEVRKWLKQLCCAGTSVDSSLTAQRHFAFANPNTASTLNTKATVESGERVSFVELIERIQRDHVMSSSFASEQQLF